MKKFQYATLITSLVFCLVIAFGACSENNSDTGNSEDPPFNGAYTLYLHANGNELAVAMEDNEAASMLKNDLQKGDITLEMHDYGGFEKVGSLGKNYPVNNAQITTEAGDVVLYGGNQMVIFYGSNTWSYTRLGKIKDATVQQIRDFLGEGDITIRLSLNE